MQVVKRRSRTSVVDASDVSEVVRLLRRLFKAIHEYSRAILAKSGLTGPQVWALTILETHPGLSARELSARMFVHPSTLTGVIDRLLRKKAIVRAVDREDRRGVRLTVTAKGRRILRATPPPVQVGLTRALADLPPRRLRELRRSLERIAAETEADRVNAPFFDVEG